MGVYEWAELVWPTGRVCIRPSMQALMPSLGVVACPNFLRLKVSVAAIYIEPNFPFFSTRDLFQ
jgi:hypothetical protein